MLEDAALQDYRQTNASEGAMGTPSKVVETKCQGTYPRETRSRILC